MKLLVWSGTPSGTVWSSRDAAEEFSLAVSQPFYPYKMDLSPAWVHRPRILFWEHSRGCLHAHGSHLETPSPGWLLVCPGKHGGIASRVFHITGNLGSGRVRSFRASFTLAALHNHTIPTQRMHTRLSTAPDNAPNGKEDKYFQRGGHKFRKPSDSDHQTEKVSTLPACPGSVFVQPSGSCRKVARAYYSVHPVGNYSLRPLGSQSGYCYPSFEMPRHGALLRLAPGANSSIRTCDRLPFHSGYCWRMQMAPRTRKNVAIRNWRRTVGEPCRWSA
jgi:hypothetical protein